MDGAYFLPSTASIATSWARACLTWRRTQAREQAMSPEQRLHFDQEHSEPLMKGLHAWMEAQLAEHKTEPNSGLGKAISYLLNHWTKLTLFLRQAGRQSVRLSHRTAAARLGTEAASVGVDALELSGHPGAARHARCYVIS
jgi:Transposase IS66 family